MYSVTLSSIIRHCTEIGHSHGFRDVLKEYTASRVDGPQGGLLGHACSEIFFGTLKVECLYGQRCKTRRHAKDESMARLLWYNNTRLHSALCYVSPMLFESAWLAKQPKQANSRLG